MGQHSTVEKLQAWLMAARPRTLPAGLVPVFLGFAASVQYHQWYPLKALGCALVALCLQVAVNFANDADDAESGVDTPRRTGPQRAVASGLISKLHMRLGVAAALAVAALTALAIVPFELTQVWVMGALAIIAALTYTGGKVAYGYKGFGEVLCFIFFGPIAVMGTTLVVAHTWSVLSLILGIGAGALSVAILEVNNIRDASTDRDAGKKTLAAIHGKKLGLKIYFGAMMTAMLTSAIVAAFYFWAWGSAIIIIFWGARLYARLNNASEGKTYNLILANTALLLLAWGTALGLSIWL